MKKIYLFRIPNLKAAVRAITISNIPPHIINALCHHFKGFSTSCVFVIIFSVTTGTCTLSIFIKVSTLDTTLLFVM